MKIKAAWLTDKYIAIMLLVFPLWTGFDGYARITLSKYSFFVAATGLWLFSLLVCAIIHRPKLKRPGKAAICALLFMLAACVSAAFSEHGSVTLLGASRYDGLVTLLLYGAIFLGISSYGEKKRYYIYLLAASATVCCAVSALQLLDINALGLFPAGLSYYDAGIKYTGEFLGTIGNVDVLAAFFCLCIPTFLGTVALSEDRRDYLLLIPAAGCLVILALSRVASGILAIAATLLVATPYYINLRFKRRQLTHIAMGASCALVVFALVLVYFWQGTSGTVHELSRVLHGEISDSFGSSRILIWRESLCLFTERPILGGGPDTLTLRSAIDFSREVTETGATLRTHVDNSHNEFLNYLVNIGLLGLLPYLALCFFAIRNWLKKTAPVLGCAVFCYLIQSFFGLGLCLVVPLVWIFMGLVCQEEVNHVIIENP